MNLNIAYYGIVFTLYLSLIVPTIIYYSNQVMSGNRADIKASFIAGIKAWPKIIVYNIVKNIIILAGLVFFIVPGVIFAYRLFFIDVIITLDGTKRVYPIEVSNVMSRGRLWRLVLYTLIVSAVVFPSIYVFSQVLFLFVDGWIANTIVDVFISLVWVLYVLLALFLFKQYKNQDELASKAKLAEVQIT